MPTPTTWRSKARLGVVLAACLTTAWVCGQTPAPAEAENIASLQRNGKRNARVHDPSTIVKCNGEYWLFATGVGIPSWRSRDLVSWEPGPRVFVSPPTWITNVVAGHHGHFWAPDVIHHHGRYLLYYSVSKFGVNTSAIALASNPTLDPSDPNYRWTDHGIVIQSQRSDDFNAIDPAVTKTPDGNLWMSFGSFWSGIKLLQIDSATGQQLGSGALLYPLAHTKAIEAPFIFRREPFYYLFVNWDVCCRGTNSTYNIRVGRSSKITGPYLDKEGQNLAQGGGTLLLGTEGAFIGPGHAGILHDNGKFWFSCHFYDGTQRGAPALAVRELRWDTNGWPELPPVEP